MRFLPGSGQDSRYCKGGYELSARGAQQQRTAEEGGREVKLERRPAATHGRPTISGFPGARNRDAPARVAAGDLHDGWHNPRRHARRLRVASRRFAGAPVASDVASAAPRRGRADRGRSLGPRPAPGRQLGPAELSLLQRLGFRARPSGLGPRARPAADVSQPAPRAALLLDGRRRLAAAVDLVRDGVAGRYRRLFSRENRVAALRRPAAARALAVRDARVRGRHHRDGSRVDARVDDQRVARRGALDDRAVAGAQARRRTRDGLAPARRGGSALWRGERAQVDGGDLRARAVRRAARALRRREPRHSRSARLRARRGCGRARHPRRMDVDPLRPLRQPAVPVLQRHLPLAVVGCDASARPPVRTSLAIRMAHLSASPLRRPKRLRGRIAVQGLAAAAALSRRGRCASGLDRSRLAAGRPSRSAPRERDGAWSSPSGSSRSRFGLFCIRSTGISFHSSCRWAR